MSPLFRNKVQEWASISKCFFPAKPASGEEGGGGGVTLTLVNWQEALNDATLRSTIAWPAGTFWIPFSLFFLSRNSVRMFTAQSDYTADS